ncbi:integrase [Intrasporangium chromatireducens Q5-1]|uniref:Integrase n=1 Tax=Intrasporangium chromatireducens Q5-1 TaxID=584657 RepID=W9GIM0_9MICO|nr:tyrosine-type recombinase/integrase [Intrasporangium chromatireducens]EWT06071.1 integrase [Intrasporangium chromatireducens Q5-1]
MATAVRPFADMLAQFLTIYLPITRACSANTVSAYRDAFTLFLRFIDQQHGIPPDRVTFTDFTTTNVAAFLGWLRTDRDCSAATVNQRLAALKSFFRYVQAHVPEQIAQARQVLSVKAAHAPQPAIGYLSVDAVGLLLQHAARRGPRDLALLTTPYDTAARVQEVCDLSIGDLRLAKPASATLTGKGRKTRTVPLTPQAAQILTEHVRALPDDPSGTLFVNRTGQRIGRAGIAYLLATCAHTAHAERPDLVPEKISPHVLRHSKAMHLLENGVNLIYIRDILGRASIVTTEIYAKANPEVKRHAIETAAAKTLGPSRYDHADRQDLLDWLRKVI